MRPLLLHASDDLRLISKIGHALYVIIKASRLLTIRCDTATPQANLDEIRRHADVGRLTGALFVDLKKAFDTVPHKELIS